MNKVRGWLNWKVGCLFAMLCFGSVLAQTIPHLSEVPAYRHLRLAQSKPFTDGAVMFIDDMWMVRSGDQQFLRVICHWTGGFPPNDFWMRASIRDSAEGPAAPKMLTWYVPLTKRGAPPGVTPFFWEFRTPPLQSAHVWLSVQYGRRDDPLDPARQIDFQIPNIIAWHDMSVPDFNLSGWSISSL